MSLLQIQLLGDFRVLYGENAIAGIHQARLQSLLAYLLLHCQTPQSRQQIAFLFWPDTSESQAHTNLRRELHNLRQVLPNVTQYLHITTKTVQWQPDAPFTFDVATFEDLLLQASQAEKAGRQAEMQAALAGALEQYRGRLLPNCYDDWILPERERLEQRFSRALEQVILLLEARRAYGEAIHYAQRLLRHDPLHEPTYRHLMRLYALNGDRAGALRVYHTCADILARELGVEPGQETQDVYARLVKVETAQPLRTPAPLTLHTAAHLVGRQAEWQQLRTAWRKTITGQAHFVLIAGEAGIGKTRLAEELFASVSQQGIASARTRSYAAQGALAYAPVIEWLDRKSVV